MTTIATDMLTPARLLSVWEQGLNQSSVRRALLLLEATMPGETPDLLARQSIGDRNRHLLALREHLFGSSFTSMAVCPACGQALELTFLAADLQVDQHRTASATLTVDHAGYHVQCRLPDSTDLLALTQGQEDAPAVQTLLLERCLTSARFDGLDIAGAALPEAVVDALSDALEAADPLAVIRLALTCPGCKQGWNAMLDIAAYLWRELDAWVRRTLREVHALASVYGWSEAAILNMRPERRRLYLDMIGP